MSIFPKKSLTLLGALCLLGGLTGCPTDDPAQENSSNSTTPPKQNNSNMCSNLCLAGETKCLNDSVVLSCGEQADGCRNFGSPERCASNEACMAGSCMPAGNGAPNQCSSSCENGDPPICKNGSVVTCADHDSNGCLYYGGAAACGSGEVCMAGECAAVSCESPCADGEARCDGNLRQICESNPKTGCLQFTPGEECGSGRACMAGECVTASSCEDECPAGEKVCGPSGVPRACEDSDGDTCVEYVDKPACGEGEKCSGGECVSVSTCEDTCTKDARICDGSSIRECRDIDSDGCVEFDTVEDCAQGGAVCDDSAGVQCTTPPVTGTVLINEIFYNPAGQDVDDKGDNDPSNDTSSSFIEISGPPGFDVSGWEVRLINGSTNMTYQSIVLPPNSALDGYGFVVISTDKADSFFTALAFTGNFVLPAIPVSGTDDGIQNGSEGVELYNASGTKVDALGYGNFDAGETFMGEGMPARGASGRSIGRVPGQPDTNDNSVDFISFFPTPGLANRDLIINEIYVDQPGTDGLPEQMETFVELVAPIQGWIDMELSGYKIRALNGLDGTDYIFDGADPGVNLSGYAINDLPGSEGFLVLCNLDSELQFFLDSCSALYEGPDYQNGPDNITLEYRGRTIDAIGYGSFGGTTVFKGEGSPAPLTSSNSGKSLNRWPTSDPSKAKDTGDNATDFHTADPSPGKGNNRP